MHLIWYNSDLKKYKFGNQTMFNEEVLESNSPDSFTVLTTMHPNSKRLADKITLQLNIASDLPLMYAF